MLPAEADLLLPQLVAGLPKPLQAKLRGLSLQDLVAPLCKDAQGKPQPGKSDPEVDTKLPKALLMRLGELCGAEAGASISAQLQRDCPTFFCAADAALLRGWELLRRAARPDTAAPDRATLLQQALHTLARIRLP